MIRDVGASIGRAVLDGIGRATSRLQERNALAADLLESDEAYLVVFDAPGVRGEDVQVKFLDHTVEVRLERFRDFYDGFDLLFPGRGLTLSSTAELPLDADVTPHGANATLTRNGTLEVEIPKDGVADDVAVVEEEDEDDDRTD